LLPAGVYAVGHPALTHEGRWMAAVLACGPGAVLSHRDAAALWDMADLAGGPVEVTVPGVGSRAQAGIRVHRTRSLAGWEVDAHRAIPVTSPARTLLDLAAVIGRRHLQLAFDEGLRSGMLSPVALEEQVKRARGRRGAPALRQLLGIDPASLASTRSPLEARFFRFCREEGLPMPLVNRWVEGHEVDMYWPDQKLIVELDSWDFHRGRESFERDRAKAADLMANGYRMIAVTHRRLTRDSAGLAATLRSLLLAG